MENNRTYNTIHESHIQIWHSIPPDCLFVSLVSLNAPFDVVTQNFLGTFPCSFAQTHTGPCFCLTDTSAGTPHTEQQSRELWMTPLCIFVFVCVSVHQSSSRIFERSHHASDCVQRRWLISSRDAEVCAPATGCVSHISRLGIWNSE